MIPRRLVRTVPTDTTLDVEKLWAEACALHPDWEHVTLRDPINRNAFPLTSPYWDECESGAQLADLVRVEDLYHNGGWYIDSDMWMLKPLDNLCALNAVVAYEDHLHIPNAVLGFPPGHPALKDVIDRAISRRHAGTWLAGVGVTTEVFSYRSDITILPPGCFYPVRWQDAHRGGIAWREVAKANPWAYGIHKYAASWHV